MIDDFRLMMEKKYMQSAIIDHRSKMKTRQELLAKLAPIYTSLRETRGEVRRTGRRKVWDMPEGKMEAGR